MMNKLTFRELIDTHAGFAALVLRVPVGIILAAHGGQKLFGWWGGPGIDGLGQYLASVGIVPGALMATLAGGAEFFGGLALIVGVLTRPAAVLNVIAMAVAVFYLHGPNGIFLSNSGFEYALTVMAVALALAIQGGGTYSVDEWLAKRQDAEKLGGATTA